MLRRGEGGRGSPRTLAQITFAVLRGQLRLSGNRPGVEHVSAAVALVVPRPVHIDGEVRGWLRADEERDFVACGITRLRRIRLDAFAPREMRTVLAEGILLHANRIDF